MSIYEARDEKLATEFVLRIRDLTDKFDLKARFFLCFAQRGFDKIFIELDMAARRKPHIVFLVHAQKHCVIIHDANVKIGPFVSDVTFSGPPAAP